LRRLLIVHDRAKGDEFSMIQEFIAFMLCVHRPSVTQTARSLQRAGLIRYGRGHITFTDQVGLEAAACECHGALRRHFEKLLSTSRG
jgi:Mn-dependent DtxR family transcriptional regulator